MSYRPPRVIGHRGAAMHAPENTIAGLEAAARLGARMVEIDAKLTADGVPVLMHDERLERTTNGFGAVAATTYAELDKLDAGAWFDDDFAGERAPTLAEALARVAALELLVNIEIKPCPGRVVETAQKVMAAALAAWPAEQPPALVSSFAWPALKVARQAAPDWPLGLLINERARGWRDWARALDVATVNVKEDVLTRDGTAPYVELGKPVLACTVNDPARADRLFADGVAGVFTDAPDRLL